MIHRARRWVIRFDLSDEDWALLVPLLPKSRKSVRVDDDKAYDSQKARQQIKHEGALRHHQ